MWANKVTIGVGAALAAIIMACNFYGTDWSDPSYTQNYLRLYASSIYEFHTLTGEWPTKTDDLAKTSLSVKYPHWWKSQLDTGADVIVWTSDLKPDPQSNRHVILCYHNKGLDAERGRMWVCWGDLRTECITPTELHEILKRQKNGEKPMDPRLVGVWQNRDDDRETWTVRPDGSLKWVYRGVPAIGIPDSIVMYTYRADPTKSPAYLDMIHSGVMGTCFYVYEVTDVKLRIGNRELAGNRPVAFGPQEKWYVRVREPGK